MELNEAQIRRCELQIVICDKERVSKLGDRMGVLC